MLCLVVVFLRISAVCGRGSVKPCAECAFPLWCASVFIDGLCVRWTTVCERFRGCWGDKLYPLGNGGTEEGPSLQVRTGVPRGLIGERAGRTWQQPPPPPPPQSPTVASKDLESDFMTPRKRGKRRLSSDSSNSEGESRLSNSAKMTRVGEDVMADTATTPPASPTDTIIPAPSYRPPPVAMTTWGRKAPNRPTNRRLLQQCRNTTLPPNRGRDTPPESLENENNNSEASPTATPAGSNSSRVPGHRHSWTSR